MTTIKFLGSTADNVYVFRMVEDGDNIILVGTNETGNSASLRFVLRQALEVPPNIRLWNTFRLTGNVDGTRETHWEGQVYRSRWNVLPMSDGSLVLSTTPQKTDAQIAAEAAEVAARSNPVNQALDQQAAANTATTTTTTTTTTTPPASSSGMGIAALLIGAVALYALLS
jgi:hypothetical protein